MNDGEKSMHYQRFDTVSFHTRLRLLLILKHWLPSLPFVFFRT